MNKYILVPGTFRDGTMDGKFRRKPKMTCDVMQKKGRKKTTSKESGVRKV